MPTVDQHIAKLDVEMVAGQGRAITFVDLLATTSTVIGDWTAVANGTALAVSASGNDVVVTWSDALATSTIGRTWRLRLSGDDKIGGRVVEARPQTTAGDETVAVTLTDPVEVTVTVAGVAVGAVDSVNGETGVVTLSAADVGADATGTASTAVSSHAAAVDPHGDRAYADALLAQHIADGTVPTIEYTMTASGVDTYSVTIPNTVRAALYVPPPHDQWPPGNHDGVVEVEPPADGNTPSWWVVLPTTSPTSFAAAWRDFIDANDHTTVVGAYTDAGSLGGVLASQGLYLCHVVPIATPDLLWSGSTPADASTMLDIISVLAGKEDAGVAQSLIDGLPVLTAGPGIDVDTDTPGESIVSATALALSPTAALASSTAETSLLTAPLTIPGPFTYASMGIVRLNVSLTNNTGSSQNVTYRIKLNGTTVATFTWSTVPTSATSRLMLGDFSITFVSFLGNPAVGFAGWGMLGAAGTGLVFGTAVAPAAVNFVTLANDLTLDVTAQLGASSSNLTTVLGSSSVQLRTLV